MSRPAARDANGDRTVEADSASEALRQAELLADAGIENAKVTAL